MANFKSVRFSAFFFFFAECILCTFPTIHRSFDVLRIVGILQYMEILVVHWFFSFICFCHHIRIQRRAGEFFRCSVFLWVDAFFCDQLRFHELWPGCEETRERCECKESKDVLKKRCQETMIVSNKSSLTFVMRFFFFFDAPVVLFCLTFGVVRDMISTVWSCGVGALRFKSCCAEWCVHDT